MSTLSDRQREWLLHIESNHPHLNDARTSSVTALIRRKLIVAVPESGRLYLTRLGQEAFDAIRREAVSALPDLDTDTEEG